MAGIKTPVFDEPNTTENYCDWRQSDCTLVAELRTELASTREDLSVARQSLYEVCDQRDKLLRRVKALEMALERDDGSLAKGGW